ncbi:MAG: DUF3467 domain-containing protein [Bacteroidetes bacterium]|nr:DUF3467 domain-containing protein [Bacteroidota bacterium]
MSDKKEEGQVNIELTEEIAEGVYSNLAVITHSNTEFVVDFVRIMPGVPRAKVKSRIVLTPHHAKRLLKAMQDNIARFESQNGEIQDVGGAFDGIPMNFGGPAPEA